MATGTAIVQSGLFIQFSSGLRYQQPTPGVYRAAVTSNSGPTPSRVTATTSGVNVDLSKLTSLGGLCFIANLDPANFVKYGIWNGSIFQAFGRLLPNESTVLRLDPQLLTGPVGTAILNSLRVVADTAPCEVIVHAFEP